jgi:UPF0042 nucleotide-binding protein
VLYLDADEATLIKRFSETRRRHPLSSESLPLAEAIRSERELLEPLAAARLPDPRHAHMTIYELRDAIRQRLVGADAEGMALLLQSFGFKRGLPGDADLVFDLRMLPNPHWSRSCAARPASTRRSPPTSRSTRSPNELFEDIAGFIERWLPGLRGQQPQLPDRGPGLHRGPAPLRVHGAPALRAPAPRHAQLQLRHRELRIL